MLIAYFRMRHEVLQRKNNPFASASSIIVHMLGSSTSLDVLDDIEFERCDVSFGLFCCNCINQMRSKSRYNRNTPPYLLAPFSPVRISVYLSSILYTM